MLTVTTSTSEFDGLPWQGSRDEDGLALANDALARVRETGDRCNLDGPGDNLAAAQAVVSQTRRNSVKWGESLPERKKAFTRSTSSA